MGEENLPMSRRVPNVEEMRGETPSRRRRARWLIARLLLAQVIVVALAILPYQAIDSDSQAMLDRMRTDVDDATERLAGLEKENQQLRHEVDTLRRDPRAIEEFARRDLGMIRPSEVLIKIDLPNPRMPRGGGMP